MNTTTLIELLELAIREPGRLPELVGAFQNAIQSDSTLSGPVEDALRDLAYDLEFYEPDPGKRAEDPSYFGESRALAEIERALRRARTLG